jgi:hypothetical protein
MEGTPEDCPVAVAFHSNRLTEDSFGGGENIFHEIFCGLLVVDTCSLHAQDNESVAETMGEESQRHGQPVVRLAGGDGDQDE